MKLKFMILILQLAGSFVFAENRPAELASDWKSFETALQQEREMNQKIGWSSIISGLLVTTGGILGTESSGSDSSAKFIYGLSQGLGVAGIGLGASKLLTGTSLDSFYFSIKNSEMSPAEREKVLKMYLEKEREDQIRNKQIRMYSHIAVGILNAYAASRETSSDGKKVFQFFSAANFAFAFAINF